LGHRQAGMAGEFLHVPQTPADPVLPTGALDFSSQFRSSRPGRPMSDACFPVRRSPLCCDAATFSTPSTRSIAALRRPWRGGGGVKLLPVVRKTLRRCSGSGGPPPGCRPRAWKPPRPGHGLPPSAGRPARVRAPRRPDAARVGSRPKFPVKLLGGRGASPGTPLLSHVLQRDQGMIQM
jgi:hypothetical protein